MLKEIARIEDKGTKLVIYTSKPEIVLGELIRKLDQNKETIVDLKVTKPTLDEIFISITESDKDRQEEADEEKEVKKKRTRQ